GPDEEWPEPPKLMAIRPQPSDSNRASRSAGRSTAAGKTLMAGEGIRLDSLAATILLVDDEHVVRTMLRAYLERSGYHVLEADSGETARKIAEQHEAIDLLLTDVVMPKMSGPELVKYLTVRRPNLKVLYMSGYSQQDLRLRSHVIEHGFGFIQKPFALEALAKWIRGILRSPPTQMQPAPD
ncbi:MAG TPA: response regulator, partial [Bryobacteraceae bacterium]|nr:response regulator [Bryobacteraceae bacterium]